MVLVSVSEPEVMVARRAEVVMAEELAAAEEPAEPLLGAEEEPTAEVAKVVAELAVPVAETDAQ
jgi:hypothetical protein